MSKFTTERFIYKSNLIHNNKYDYSKTVYSGSNKKLNIICPIHGIFSQTAGNHLQGRGCQKCGKGSLSNTKDFIEKSSIIHNNYYLYNETIYDKVNNKVIITCPKHGNFEQTPNNHLSGHGCSKCKLKTQNKLYRLLKLYIDDLLWEYSPKWLINQRFDMYSPKYNIAIEYNGKQHYECINYFDNDFNYIQKLDRVKQIKCKENNCELYTIKYDYVNEDIEYLIKILKNKLLTLNN